MAYWYVDIVNPLRYCDENWNSKVTETAKLIDRIVKIGPLKHRGIYSSFYALLQNIKEEDSSLKPFPIICEDNGDMLEDVITGKLFNEERKQIGFWDNGKYETQYYRDSLCLTKVTSITDEKLIELLKSLSKEDLKRYEKAINKLAKLAKVGYKKDIKRAHSDMHKDKIAKGFSRKLKKEIY